MIVVQGAQRSKYCCAPCPKSPRIPHPAHRSSRSRSTTTSRRASTRTWCSSITPRTSSCWTSRSSSRANGRAKVRARVVSSSPRHTKRLLNALQKNLERYEERYGTHRARRRRRPDVSLNRGFDESRGVPRVEIEHRGGAERDRLVAIAVTDRRAERRRHDPRRAAARARSRAPRRPDRNSRSAGSDPRSA